MKGEKQLMQLMEDDWDLVRELADRRFVLTKLFELAGRDSNSRRRVQSPLCSLRYNNA